MGVVVPCRLSVLNFVRTSLIDSDSAMGKRNLNPFFGGVMQPRTSESRSLRLMAITVGRGGETFRHRVICVHNDSQFDPRTVIYGSNKSGHPGVQSGSG